VIDRVGGRVYVMPAIITGIGTARGYLVMLGNALTLLTVDAVRIEIILEPFKASIIIRKLLFKVSQGVFGKFGWCLA